jgi:hypothetical protein
MKALSIRQPWAWLIVNGYKDIENRSWPTRYRGDVLVHASKGMTREEYYDVEEMLRLSAVLSDLSVPLPAFEALERGGIVGKVTITGCITASKSPWFFGKYGFCLLGAKPLPFAPVKGALGFFEVDGEL